MPIKAKQYLVSISFIAPAFVLFFILFLYPVVAGFTYGFTNWDGLSAHPEFTGLKNFKEFFTDPDAVNALGRTLWSTIVIVIVQNGIGLFMASILDSNIKRKDFFKTIYFMPAILSSVIVGYLWTFIFDPLNGVVASALNLMGTNSLSGADWLGDPKIALYSVMAVLIWQYFGYSMVIYLSGLQSIPVEYYEASDIDGANSWRKFWHVKFPLIAPAFTINMVLSVIGALKIFDHIFVLTKGGPGRATETLTVLIYKEAFGANRMGYGAAASMILLSVIMIVALIQLKLLQSRELEG